MKQGTELDATDSFLVINELYYPAHTDTTTPSTCIDTFTAEQTAMISGTTYLAVPVVLNQMTSKFPLVGRYSYPGITTPASVDVAAHIVCSSSELANLV
jgi:hypothetical protein